GDNETVLQHQGPNTRLLDVKGRTVLPGLYDSHAHPAHAAVSEFSGPLPALNSLKDVFAYIQNKTAATPPGEWIIGRIACQTRLEEGRFQTRAELDAVAPKPPVLYHAGPAGLVNTLGLKISGITKDTPNPPAGTIVKDLKTGEPTGMLRNAYGVLKGLPRDAGSVSAASKRDAVRQLFRLYDAQGLTSVADRDASRSDLDVYLALRQQKQLTVRVNVSRSFDPDGTREEIVRRLEELPGKDKRGGPTGAGDEWVRIGPIKLFLDGGMLNGTAYMRQPWPPGDTYQIVDEDYRGLLCIPPEELCRVVGEGSRRRCTTTAHAGGGGAMDGLMDASAFVNRQIPIKELRFCITHANFPSQRNLERCQRLGVCADVQPAWLWKDGGTLQKVLGDERMRWFQPYKSWLKYTTIGGGSDHMLRFDPLDSTNPWSPWLGIWITLTRKLERGGVHQSNEILTREEAIRLYTINNAFLHHEEKERGSLEVGKLGDLIVVDRDIMTCSVDEIKDVKV